MVSQKTISEYERRKTDFGRVRALIRKILMGSPNLTVEEIAIEFSRRYGFLPRIGNRLREDRKVGLVVSRVGGDGRKRWSLAPSEREVYKKLDGDKQTEAKQ